MKKINLTTKPAKRITKESDKATSKFEILDLNAMRRIRGGEGEANGGEVVILTPPKK
jgi:hypothetical protein